MAAHAYNLSTGVTQIPGTEPPPAEMSPVFHGNSRGELSVVEAVSSENVCWLEASKEETGRS